MKVLYFVIIGVLVVIVAVSFVLKGESTHFYGIAESREIVVNSDNAVEINKIQVVQGQVINEGDTLVELNQPELTMKISEITHQLDELKAQKLADASVSRSQIRQLEAQQETKVNEIKTQIRQLEAQYEMNKRLASELKSINKKKSGTSEFQENNPIKIKIESLKRELEFALHPSQIKIESLKSGLYSSGDPTIIQVQGLESELKLLLEEKRKLVKFAQINGIIGSVNFKEGEKVSPFVPIVTLHTKSPSYIKGYIHEEVYNKIAIGQKVDILSMTDRSNRTEGEVVGVGSRIVEYPVRLRKRQDFQIWGREVVIKIPPENTFLLGEKVLITSSRF